MQEAETASDKIAVIHYHEEECMYLEALDDRVTVIFSTLFKDPDDVIIGKVRGLTITLFIKQIETFLYLYCALLFMLSWFVTNFHIHHVS